MGDHTTHTDAHLDLLSEVGEWLARTAGSTDVSGFLDKAIELVARHLDAAVCSIYLFDERREQLVLRANVGLTPESVDSITLAPGEGLVGTALKELRPICVDRAGQHPNFKAIPGSGEEPYDAFLAVPILRGIERIGVFVVQREADRPFTPTDVRAMRALTVQLAGAVESARVMLDLRAKLPAETEAVAPVSGAAGFIRGEPASSGCGYGPSLLYLRGTELSVLSSRRETPFDVGGVEDLERALAATRRQLAGLQQGLGERMPEAATLIFDAHLLMLNDESFSGAMREAVGKGATAGAAILKVAHRFMDLFASSSHDYMREKAHDVEDLARRLLSNLVPDADGDTAAGAFGGRVLIARDVLPSEMLRLAAERVAGLVLAGGGITSHVAILARSLGVPLVILEAPALSGLPDGTPVLVDADSGNVHIQPSDEVRARYREKRRAHQMVREEGAAMSDTTRTLDGTRVVLMANINLLGELDLATALKAEGIGLYRTEFPFLVRDSLPTEDEQVRVFRLLFERMRGREVTVRTLDAGGDKVLSYFDMADEPNPELGLRSTRFLLRHPEIFDQQLRAVLRAMADGTQVRLMFPMIGSIDEFREARLRVAACWGELGERGRGRGPMPPVGMMLELPAVAEVIDGLAEESAFFSIGTNDFVQYMLAADRTNERVAEYYVPHHPAVLRSLARMVRAVNAHGRDLSICGEMAHDSRYIPFLLGIGVRKLSVDPRFLPAVQRTIETWSVEQAAAYAEELLALQSVREVDARLKK